MRWDVIDVRVVGYYELEVTFRDNLMGIVRFFPTFFRGVFVHLNDASQFRSVEVIDGVVTWPNNLDLAPDAMHKAIQETGEWILK